MKNVIAKFSCIKNDHNEEAQASEVSFYPVVEGSEENKSFAKYTPGGELVMIIDDETPAAGAFEVGEEYYLLISKEKPQLVEPEQPKQEQPEALKMKNYRLRAVHNRKSVNPMVKGRSEKEMRKNAEKDFPGIKIITFERVE